VLFRESLLSELVLLSDSFALHGLSPVRACAVVGLGSSSRAHSCPRSSCCRTRLLFRESLLSEIELLSDSVPLPGVTLVRDRAVVGLVQSSCTHSCPSLCCCRTRFLFTGSLLSELVLLSDSLTLSGPSLSELPSCPNLDFTS
jgi:hypothetical protein